MQDFRENYGAYFYFVCCNFEPEASEHEWRNLLAVKLAFPEPPGLLFMFWLLKSAMMLWNSVIVLQVVVIN